VRHSAHFVAVAHLFNTLGERWVIVPLTEQQVTRHGKWRNTETDHIVEFGPERAQKG
jgi:hypothetical protein